MNSGCLTPRWSIPGVGMLRPSYDSVRIVSSVTVGSLKRQLPIAALVKASHKFTIVTYKGPDPTLRSVIKVTCANDLLPIQILEQHHLFLGNYRIVNVEIAFDIRARGRARSDDDKGETADANARKKLFALIGMLSKPRHFRKCLVSVHKPETVPRAGHLNEPTFYFEDRKSSVALKTYCRKIKLKNGGFGGACVRLEWTLKYKTSINRHLGGGRSKNLQIEDLLKVDLNKFAKTNLRLEKVDHLAIGRLVRGARLGKNSSPPWTAVTTRTIAQQFKDPAYLNKRAADLVLRNLAHRELKKFGDWQKALIVCFTSPAQIRGYLSPTKSKRLKRGRPKKSTRRRAISPYRISACFQPIQLQPV